MMKAQPNAAVANTVNVLVVEDPSDRKSFPPVSGVKFRSCGTGDLAAEVPWAEVLLFRTFETVDLREVWPRAMSVRWIHASSAGLDRLLDPAVRDGAWTLTNSTGILDSAIAEYVAAGVLASVKRIPESVRLQGNRMWKHRITGSVSGRRALVVGPGSIGRRIARTLSALGMSVDAAGTTARGGDADFGRVRRADQLVSYAGEYDVVVLSTPLTEHTRGLVDAGVLASMRPDAGLVNIARGPVVDEPALCEALASGTIGWAVLDVFETEPLPATSPLWDLDNVILSAHMAGDSDDFSARLWNLFADNLRRYLDGSVLINIVDKQAGYVRR